MNSSVHGLRGRRVLVVEDEFFIGVDLVEQLELLGTLPLGPISNIDDALKLITRDEVNIDVVVLDINLKGELAFPVAQALEARHIPYVFATGYDRRSLPARYAQVPHCEKPVSPRMLARSLLELLRLEPE
jgi:CheY-like chemotaxis protein